MRALLLALAVVAFSTPAASQDAKADADRALRGIDSFTSLQAKSDPHFAVVEDALLKEIDDLLKTTAPNQWLATIRQRYFALSEAEHQKERDTIRAGEAAALARLGGGDRGWAARSAELEAELKAGKLGPRLHAMRLREAALLYHPGNDLFAAWRAAKVPIATEFELGLISRSEYEDRWNKVTASFMQRQAADDRVREAIQAQAAAEEYRAAVQNAQPVRTPRPIRCTTSTSFGVTTTRCN